MANLNSLPIKSISKMDRDELIAHILKIRNDRRGLIKPQKATTTKTRQKSESKSTKDLVSMLSPEQALRLLDQLGDGDNEEEDDERN